VIQLRLENFANARRFEGGESNPLRPVSWRFEGGEAASIMGPSGSGKTLLLRAISDLDPVVGNIYLDGKERREFSGPDWRRRVGYVAAESAWWSDRLADCFDDVNIPLLHALGFKDSHLERMVSGLSTGERQRLAILRALGCRPQALLLDEPTAALDAGSAATVERVIADYRAQTGCAVIWVSHDAAQSRRIAATILEVNNGVLHAPNRDRP